MIRRNLLKFRSKTQLIDEILKVLPTYRSDKLIGSFDRYGNDLDSFYRKCAFYTHKIILVKTNFGKTCGMYYPATWKNICGTQTIENGRVFVFFEEGDKLRFCHSKKIGKDQIISKERFGGIELGTESFRLVLDFRMLY